MPTDCRNDNFAGSPACAGRSNGRTLNYVFICKPKILNMWFVYIIKSTLKKWYYVGSTNRFKERLNEHSLGRVKSTKLYRPFVLIFSKKFSEEIEARKYEKKLKDCRIEKENIIKEYEKI